MEQGEIARDDLGEPDGGAAAGCDEAVGPARRRDARFRNRLRHVHHRLRVQPRRPRAQYFDELPAEARAAARRRDHQDAVQAEPRRLVADALDRARGEHDALGGGCRE